MDSPQPIVVVTDVDDALFAPGERGRREAPGADDALDFLAAHDIPLVINTGRTRAEIERLHHTLHIVAPFISENGGGLFLPHSTLPFTSPQARRGMGGDVIDFGEPYARVVDVVRRTCGQLGVEIVGLADLSIEEVSRELDVGLAQARLAKLREYSELFRIVDGTDALRKRLAGSLHRQGLRCWQTPGGHLVAATPDRAESLRTLRAIWTRAAGDPLVIGLGDSVHDVPWLKQVDIAVIVRREDGPPPEEMLASLPDAHVTRRSGPRGWSEAIFYLLGGLYHEPVARLGLQHPRQDPYSLGPIPVRGRRF